MCDYYSKDDNTLMENTQLKIYELTKKFEEEEPLKIYFMSVVGSAGVPDVVHVQKSIGIIAYRYMDALTKARDIYIAGRPGAGIASSEKDFETVANILKNVKYQDSDIQKLAPQIIMETKNSQDHPKPTKEQFITRLKLASEEMVKDEVDKKELKRILEKINP